MEYLDRPLNHGFRTRPTSHPFASQEVKRFSDAVFVLAPNSDPERIAGFYTLSASALEDVAHESNNILTAYIIAYILWA